MQYLLNGEDLKGMRHYLVSRQWIGPDETLISARKPGEGNMNYTIRIRTNFRTFILKQSRNYVEKYPQIPAPVDRAIIEGRFYDHIQQHADLRRYTPEVMYMDEENSILMLEDLGDSFDYTSLYQPNTGISREDLNSLISFLNVLHHEISPDDTTTDFSNRDMRALNGEHIFRYPFMVDNGFDLDTVTKGLQTLSMEYKTDDILLKAIARLEQIYQADGPHLLHGDFYPGSWLSTLDGVKVIDPEFGFFGPAEFDLSVMIAHTYLAGLDEDIRTIIQSTYVPPSGYSSSLTEGLVGVEILRRLIGLAQLPLSLSLSQKEGLMKLAKEMIV